MKLTSKNITIISAILLSLSACDEAGITSLRNGTRDAKYSQKHIHKQYLDCYALDKSSKATCVDELNKEHISLNLQKNSKYLADFQYEAEKRGFKHFLNSSGKICDVIDEGPRFDSNKHRYVVRCISENVYFMSFNYETKEWQLRD